MALRDGITPIYGISPDELDRASHKDEFRAYRQIKLTTRRNAIYKHLFGQGVVDFEKTGREKLERVFKQHRLCERKDLLDIGGPVADPFAPARGSGGRRSLADYLFLRSQPLPARVFTGSGHDSSWWHELNDCPPYESLLDGPHVGDPTARPRNNDEARKWVEAAGGYLTTAAGYFEGRYSDPAPAADHTRLQLYFHDSVGADERLEEQQRLQRISELFTQVVLKERTGWLDVIPLTPNLIALKEPGGCYDLIWRDLRETSEPAFEQAARQAKSPRLLIERETILRERYRSPGVWNQLDEHESEIRYNASKTPGLRYPGQKVILERYLRDKQAAVFTVSTVEYHLDCENSADSVTKSIARLGQSISVNGLKVWDLITILQYRQFLEISVDSARVLGDEFDAANKQDHDDAPVCISYAGALAYISWLEQELNCPFRLLTEYEHRSMRPGVSWSADPDNYDEQRMRDAKEHPAGVTWSSHRGDADRTSLEARWVEPIRYTVHASVTFMDATDAPEWCMEGLAVNRLGTMPYGKEAVGGSWGEYKRCKTCFRVIADNPDS